MPAEVISVDYKTVNPSRLYTILCKFLNAGVAGSPTDVIQARPLHANIKNIPIEGEVVFVCKAPSPYHSGAGYGREFYYTHPISIQSSVHHNGLPGANLILLDKKSQKDKAQDARTGITRKLTDRTDTKQT
ncbi:MAG: hypothetical protein ACK55I_51050, partial [bacterium]